MLELRFTAALVAIRGYFFRPMRGSPLNLTQQRIEILLPEEAVSVHRMAMSSDLPRPLPIAEGVRRNAEVVGCLGDPEIIPQLGHATVSTSIDHLW